MAIRAPPAIFSKLLNTILPAGHQIYPQTSVVIPMATATTRAYTAEQPIAIATERAKQKGRRQVGLKNWRKTK
jgi:hypothetical protein